MNQLEDKIIAFWNEIAAEIKEEQDKNEYEAQEWENVINEQQTLYRLIRKFYDISDTESEILITFNKMFNMFHK